MRITRVNVKKFDNPEATVKGIVEVTLNDCFVIKDIRIIEKPEKMVVAMPSKSYVTRGTDDMEGVRKHKDLAHPINAETRKIFNDIILEVFARATSGNDYEEEVDVLVCEG